MILRMPEEASLEAQKARGSLWGTENISVLVHLVIFNELHGVLIRDDSGSSQCHASPMQCNLALLGWHAAVARHGLAKPALRCLDS